MRVRRRTTGDKMDGTDWASGPPSCVLLQCGHQHIWRPPSPAKGDVLTCQKCGTPTVVLLPIRRMDRHAPMMSRAELLGHYDRIRERPIVQAIDPITEEPEPMPADDGLRRCQHPQCGTLLSRYNKTKWCSLHERYH